MSAFRSVKALLFSDVKGFGKMSERECLAFCRAFHAGVQQNVLSKYDDLIVLKNTWGDALHVVMDDIAAAGRLALDLRDWMNDRDWTSDGLEAPPRIRIGLHAGVVSRVPDPITNGCNFIGRNTSKAARIEPIAFEGQVFVSRVYAALLSLDSQSGLVCDYVGKRELPKKSGFMHVYLLRKDPQDAPCVRTDAARRGPRPFHEVRPPRF